MEFSEGEQILDDRPIRQGDVIRFLATSDPWENLGVIVTADCDISWNKHGGRLTYVPILTATHYLGISFLPKRLERLSANLGARIVQRMRAFQGANLPEFPIPLTDQRPLDWLLDSGPERVADVLLVTDSQGRPDFMADCKAYIQVRQALDASYPEQWSAICAAEVHLRRAVSAEDAGRKLLKDAQSFMERLPGDALFLSCLSPNYAGGYVCYLRLLREIRHPQIAIRFSQRDSEVLAERFAHLRSPYVYRLTQQLAEVFASIALPKEYEESRGTCLLSLAPRQRTHSHAPTHSRKA